MRGKTKVVLLAGIWLATWLIPLPKRKGTDMLDEETPRDPSAFPFRSRIIAIAAGQIGQPESYAYAAGALGISEEQAIAQHTEQYSWCGLFATWVLQQAGAGVYWTPGAGLSPRLQTTNQPQPGDVAYVIRPSGMTKDVHHYAIVESVGSEIVTTIDGNSTGGVVARRTRPIGEFDSFFDVSSLDPTVVT